MFDLLSTGFQEATKEVLKADGKRLGARNKKYYMYFRKQLGRNYGIMRLNFM